MVRVQNEHVFFKTRLLILLLLPLLLTACVAANTSDPNSIYYTIPAGSALTINKEITFKPDRLRVWFQWGEIVHYNNVNTFEPHCSLLLSSKPAETTVVKPDEVLVRKVLINIHSGLSGTRWARHPMMDIDGGDMVDYTTYLYLSSSAQPFLHSIECRQRDTYQSGRHVTVDEIRKALGDYFTLKLGLSGG